MQRDVITPIVDISGQLSGAGHVWHQPATHSTSGPIFFFRLVIIVPLEDSSIPTLDKFPILLQEVFAIVATEVLVTKRAEYSR